MGGVLRGAPFNETMSRYTDIDALLTSLGAGATVDEVEYALRDHITREVIAVLADRAAAGGGGSSPLTVATVTLTNAQVKALPTTPVELIPAQGVDAVIVPVFASLRTEWVADYTNIDVSAVISFPPGLLTSLSNVIASTVSALLAGGGPDGTWAFVSVKHIKSGDGPDFGFSNFYDADLANVPLTISATNAGGNFTGGNAGNSVTVTVTYYVATF